MVLMEYRIDCESFSFAIILYTVHTGCSKTQYFIECVLLIRFIITVTETFISQLYRWPILPGFMRCISRGRSYWKTCKWVNRTVINGLKYSNNLPNSYRLPDTATGRNLNTRRPLSGRGSVFFFFFWKM